MCEEGEEEVSASKLIFTLLLATGRESVSTGEAITIFNTTRAHYSMADIDARMVRVVKIRDRYARYNNLEERDTKLWLYREVVNKRGYNRKNRTYVMLPPMFDASGYKWIGGFAEDTKCLPRGVAIGNALAVRSNGSFGYDISAIAMTHELAHLCNARHEEGANNIMHPAALQFTGQPIGFTQRSVRDMKRCLGNRR